MNCSKIFVIYSPNKIRCDACQRTYKLETKKRRERLRRRNYRGLDQILGSGDKSTYLTILPNGRILGAVWLESEMKKLNGSKRRNVNMKGEKIIDVLSLTEQIFTHYKPSTILHGMRRQDSLCKGERELQH